MPSRQLFAIFDEYELDQMSRYLNVISKAIEEEKREFETFAQKSMNGLSEDEVEQFMWVYEDDYSEIAEKFPRLLFSSFLVSWYSYIENRLVQLCRRKKLEITVRFEDNIRFGSGIDKVKLFLKKSAEYEVDPKHWQELMHIRKIRNIIAHNGGRLPISRSETRKSVPWKFEGEVISYLLLDGNFYNYLNGHELIDLKGVLFVIPCQSFCRHLIAFGKELLMKIYSDIEMISHAEFSKKIKDKQQ